MADTLTAPKAGRVTLRRSAQTSPRSIRPAPEYARAFMLRLARRLADRASVKRAHRAEDSAQRVARLAPAACWLEDFLSTPTPTPSPWHSTRDDGSLYQATQALRAGDACQAVKMLKEAAEQLRAPLAPLHKTERQQLAHAIRTTRLMMANPDRIPSLPVLDLDALLSDFQPEHLSGFEPEPQTSASTGAEVWGVAA
ncbi:hypothetical protein VITFI_CDS0556 [Vitreoscilla filiformis]|uniref:Uncharacterized protein n=1 Tax=Vitreoscilla filiformis TaxID=63 RepID=A0A221KBI1_VITFI|nr:hypothetical protein [Vitreoscilla filiformis]ASM76335.1 hypothetical protein VITFI_CDS0556 [Vitreoscilla filiformis]